MTTGGAVNLRPIGWVFVLFGLFWGGWAVAAVDIEQALRLSNGGFGLLLSVALVGAGGSNAVGGSLCERHGTGRVLGVALAVWSAFLVLGSLVRDSFAMELVIVAMVATAGLVDIAINVAATAALGSQPGRLVAFHGRFNAGAAVGAALTGVVLATGASWRWVWVGTAVVALVLSVVCGVSRSQPVDPGSGRHWAGPSPSSAKSGCCWSQWPSHWPHWWRAGSNCGVSSSCGPGSRRAS